jgi:cysteine desulfurase family protein (TIGR01976 family)
MFAAFDVDQIRREFPALSLKGNDGPAAYFDGPAGSQVPQRVVRAVCDYLSHTNANHGGSFVTSRQSDRILEQAHRTLADFLGTSAAECVVFGPNMTSLTLSLSRALGRTWDPDDEIIVTSLEHDANVTPWMLAARDAGVHVHHVGVRPGDCTLNLADFEAKLSDRTRLVAVSYASNATGTINPVRGIVERAHSVDALVFVDAVHYAPHGLIDVAELDCDFLVCSAYKFFGPHVGILWGKRTLLESLPAYKLRSAPDELPEKWMTGTQNHEGIAGTAAAVEYLAELGRSIDPNCTTRREALTSAFGVIVDYERELVTQLIAGLGRFENIRIWGITEPSRFAERVPTVSFTHRKRKPREIAEKLAAQGIFVWSGNHYALPFTEAMNLEPDGTLRVGLMHYNTAEEIERLLRALQELE